MYIGDGGGYTNDYDDGIIIIPTPVNRMDSRRNTFDRLFKTAIQSVTMQYSKIEGIMTGKTLHRKIKHVTDAGLTDEVDYDTRGQDHYSELHIVSSIKEVKEDRPDEMSFTLHEDDARAKDDSENTSERTPFLEACLNGQIDKVREMDETCKDGSGNKDESGNNALMLAVRGGHNDLVRILIKEFHFNVNSRGCKGRTPLHETCLQGHTDLVRELINEHGADLEAKDNDSEDALMYAVDGGHKEVVRVLIKEFHFDVNSRGRTPLHEACFQGHTDLVRELVNEHGADLEAKYNKSRDVLMYAVSGGHKEMVRVLIKEFHFNVNSRGYNGRTPLHEACSQGHTDLVRELVNEHGADLEAKDNDSIDALMYAVGGGHKEVVRVLIKEFHFNVNTS